MLLTPDPEPEDGALEDEANFRDLSFVGSGAAREEGADDDDDDPSKRAFDWEKDMKVGGQISNSQRQQLLNRAANFGGRFQKGSFL